MLAPTRELVAQLNAAARTARIAGHRTGRAADLSDGNQASVGDIMLTRRNNRTLNTGETAWVRNGDRSEPVPRGTDMASYAAEWSQPTAEWVSLQQAALIYGVSVDTLRRRIATGELPASRIGARLIRVRTADLDRVCRPIVVVQRTTHRRRA